MNVNMEDNRDKAQDIRIAELKTYIEKMLETYHLVIPGDEAERNFVEQKVLKILRGHIDSVLTQQSGFNSAVTPAIGKITELLNIIVNKTHELSAELATLNGNHTDFVLKQESIEQQLAGVREEILKDLDIIKDKHSEQNSAQHSVQQQLAHEHQVILRELDDLKGKLGHLEQLGVMDNSGSNFYMNSYSQAGEDTILDYIIRVNRIPYHEVSYIDLGANHAKNLSNTYHFYAKGGKGVIVEANPDLIPDLTFYRNRDIVLNNCVDVVEGKSIDFYIMNVDGLSTTSYENALEMIEINPELKVIDKKTITTVSYNYIVDHYLGRVPTILSVDLEGKDMEVLQSIDYESKRPFLIIVEVIDYDTKLAYSTKNTEVKAFMESQGYDEYAFTGINSIFIDTIKLNELTENK
ncbi:hypothetical protein DNH61_07675 [Paenibacillus sambharensis]|uniref:Methyltransferase FkbM domain-containing protein n=1 Tax=Paenibacillus sambharensis TaxID=1803190 RepID=A0A2W1LBV5_9BACL|nr:FkbM family methyltransferase [Paenibacillus sambharensis]PZD96383.1 hypothetical protein DNH61_07675 [Paenibacillus sambharensis]